VALTCGAQTLAVTNVVGSTAAREADDTILIRAGPEIGVAATKTFTSQAVTLVLLSQRLARGLPQASCRDDLPALLEAVRRIPSDVERVIEHSAAADLGNDLLGYDAYFFIGRARSYPVALEGALKFKEITYEHAEGFSSGQLKHGPLALVTPNTPVFALFTGETTDKTVTNAKEAQTRGADIVGVGGPVRRTSPTSTSPSPTRIRCVRTCWRTFSSSSSRITRRSRSDGRSTNRATSQRASRCNSHDE
jgi:glucosamine--fructose-6-phosphate aminotransferase (isomerizing)